MNTCKHHEVGKTALVQQFLNAGTAFPKSYSMTLGAEVVAWSFFLMFIVHLVSMFIIQLFILSQVASKLVHIPDTSDAVELLILDCSGREVINPVVAFIFIHPSKSE